jgi:hypothetical protein
MGGKLAAVLFTWRGVVFILSDISSQKVTKFVVLKVLISVRHLPHI